jgi:hypothetical protein
MLAAPGDGTMTRRLGASMIQRRSDRGWLLPGLGASGPASPLASKLHLFGQFVGDWQIFSARASKTGRAPERPVAEACFRWVLGGTAVQDVWGPLDDRTGRLVPVGSTLRFYDPSIRAWRSIWICPYAREARRFIGRKVGSEIVLKEHGRGRKGERWIFSEITRSSFRWRAEARSGTRGWRIYEEYRIRRRVR